MDKNVNLYIMETTERKQSERIQTSILNAAERKALVWLASKQPAWMTSNILTFIGVIGSVIIALGYILSDRNISWLWLASAGFVINWYGDSLDGSLARFRKTQRPVYGFYLDHMVDVFNEMFMFVGVGDHEKGTDNPHHSVRFNIDEDMLPLGVKAFVKTAMEYLR